MLCWKPEKIEVPGIEQLFDKCAEHNKDITFICESERCKNKMLVCNVCYKSHHDHDLLAKQEYFNQDIENIILGGQSMMSRKLQLARQEVLTGLDKIKELYNNRVEEIRTQFIEKTQTLQQKYTASEQFKYGEFRINNETMKEIDRIYRAEESGGRWIDLMMQEIPKITDLVYQSFNSILGDLDNIFDPSKWEEAKYFQDTFKELEKHLHTHPKPDTQYFRFSHDSKQPNIVLFEEKLKARYENTLTTKPVAVLNSFFTEHHSKVGFQIVKLDTKLFIFPVTTIYLGVCISSIVKGVGMRKISEPNKGSFLIGCSGWCYHHNDPKYDRKEIVGWNFKEGDKIEVEVSFQGHGMVKFTKIGKLFDSHFEMPLNIKEKKNLFQLKPVIGFDADEGAEVRTFNF